MIDILMIMAGLCILLLGGEGLIRGSVSLANSFHLSKLLIGLVVVGFGTSMPEMTVSVSAALKGASDIALGNVVGSNIANILLILGLSSLIYPISFTSQSISRDGTMMMGASVSLCLFAVFGILNAYVGFLFLMGLIAYICLAYFQEKQKPNAVSGTESNNTEISNIDDIPNLGLMKASLFSVGGLLFLVAGSYLMVDGAISVAQKLGVSEAVIGLTIVAIGTSLPELAASVIATLKKQPDMIIGNIVGSNIFNILAILGVTLLISPIQTNGQILQIDIWVMLGVAAFLSIFLFKGLTISRSAGGFMLAAYILYIGWLYSGMAS